jgi:hypothetical protein
MTLDSALPKYAGNSGRYCARTSHSTADTGADFMS